jgi:hypothetical protein
MPPRGIGTGNPSKRAAADPRLIDRAIAEIGFRNDEVKILNINLLATEFYI